MQIEKREIHPVFHRFPNFYLVQNLSLSTLADLIIGYLKGETVTCKMDVVRFFDGDDWIQRKKAYFDFCEDWEAVSDDHYTYNDYEDKH